MNGERFGMTQRLTPAETRALFDDLARTLSDEQAAHPNADYYDLPNLARFANKGESCTTD